jgi:ubiquinone/menaquinone biosynthesis C-methylase UbiE
MVVADVGCGSGIQLALLAPHVKEIVGFDFSEDMVRLARHRVESQRIPNATVVQCDARAIKAGSATFDAAYCLGLLDNMPAPADTLSERNRIVKQAGEIVFTVPKRPSLFAPLRWGPGLWVRRHLFSLPPVLSVLSLEQLRAVAGSAGIDVDQVSSVWTTMWIAHGRTRV